MYGTGAGSDPAAVVAVVALLAAVHARDWIRDRLAKPEKEREHDRLTDAYVNGEIDEREYERRLDVLLDPRNEEIREHVERVNGIGPITSREIALSFESIGELRRADQEEIEAVSGVGPDRAAAVRERL